MAPRVNGGARPLEPCAGIPVTPALRVVVFAPRERTRAFIRAALPHRRWHVNTARQPARFAAAFHSTMIDAAIVELGGLTSPWPAAELAREFPMIPFLGVAPFRLSDSEAIESCAMLGFSDVLADGIDDDMLQPALEKQALSLRFSRGILDPPAALKLRAPIQVAAWRHIVAEVGRPISTSDLARRCGISREHLSRTFARDGAPALKEAIDLVRLLAAGLLSKNPGLDLADVSRILGFGGTAQLGRLCRRILGRPAHSLPRLRAEDAIAIWSSAR